MLRLQTLGNVFVTGPSGEPLRGAASQRRTLALLAVLAVAGEGGLSRDKLVGLLWPESDPERARHSLTQALYAAKRALEADDLFLVNADVRLNRERIRSDVQDLEAALDSGDLELAVALYAGAFLDGFFLAGSPEFEQWSSLQRTRIEARVTQALERLAEQAEGQGETRSCIEWRRRLAVIRPLDSGNALKLMKCLMDSGDRAGALQHARLHEQMLRDQLDLDPDPAIVALVNKLREPGDQRVSLSGGAPEPAPIGARSGDHPAAAVTLESIGASPSPWSKGIAAVLRQHRRQLLAAVILLVVLAGSLVLLRPRSSPPAPTRALRQKVVVAPFRVLGAASSLGYLRDGMVELLSTRLADDTAARAVDAGAVLRAWDDAGVTGSVTLPRDSIVKLAATLGAERVVIGSVIGTPRRLIVRASVAAVPSGVVSGEASVEGPSDSISTLIDGLAAKLLVSEAGEDERLASYTTTSLRALRAYLAGQAALRQNHYEEATRHYRRALGYDSGFALAALQLAVAADRLNLSDEKHQGIALAWQSRKVLSERDLAELEALAGTRYPLPSSARELLAVWRRLAELAPNNVESWYLYGAQVFHNGALVGVAEPEQQSITLLRRALALDPGYVPAELLLTQLATRNGAAVSLPRTGQVDSANPFAAFLRWRSALAAGDSTAQRRMRSAMRDATSVSLRMIAMASQFDAMNLADAALALGILQARAKSMSEQVDVVLGQHSLALVQGRPNAALEATTRLAAIQPGSQAYLRLRVLDALYAEGDTAAGSAAARRLETLTRGEIATGTTTAEVHFSNICTLGQWRLSQGDSTGVRAAIATLHAPGPPARPTSSLIAAPALCGDLLDAWLVALTRPSAALPRLESLDSLVLTPEVAGDAIMYAPLLLARLFEQVGESNRALQAIRKRVYMKGWPRYLGTALRREGRLAALAGDVVGAREALDRYLILRASPERRIAPQVDSVRSQGTALHSEAGYRPPEPRDRSPVPRQASTLVRR